MAEVANPAMARLLTCRVEPDRQRGKDCANEALVRLFSKEPLSIEGEERSEFRSEKSARIWSTVLRQRG